MIKTDIYEQVLFDTVKRGATEISPDVEQAFEKAIEKETKPDAKKGLISTLESMKMSKWPSLISLKLKKMLFF